MNQDELATFVAIARLGSFTAASRSLGRSQPAITRRIQQLEEEVGASLFERDGRAVALSEAGRVLLPHAESALAAARDGLQAVQDLQRGEAGEASRLELAIVGTLADSALVDALRTFEADFADVSVGLRTANSREVSALVRSGEADLGLRYFADSDPRLESTPLGAERLCVVVPAGHPLRQRRLRDLRKLEGERWLGFPPERGQPESFGRQLEQALRDAGFADPSFTRVDSLTAQKRLVEAGLGVALMPRSSLHEELRLGSLRAIELERPALRLPVVVVSRRGGYASRPATAFVEALREALPALTPRRRGA